MVWSNNDSWMVTGDHSGFIKYWQSNMNNVKMFQGHKEPVRGIRWDSGRNVTMATILIRIEAIFVISLVFFRVVAYIVRFLVLSFANFWPLTDILLMLKELRYGEAVT